MYLDSIINRCASSQKLTHDRQFISRSSTMKRSPTLLSKDKTNMYEINFSHYYYYYYSSSINLVLVFSKHDAYLVNNIDVRPSVHKNNCDV